MTTPKRRMFLEPTENEDCHYWIDVQNVKHRLDEMDDEYVVNCIKFMKGRKDREWERNTLIAEMKRRKKIKKTRIGRSLYS